MFCYKLIPQLRKKAVEPEVRLFNKALPRAIECTKERILVVLNVDVSLYLSELPFPIKSLVSCKRKVLRCSKKLIRRGQLSYGILTLSYDLP